jgi:hypothetical protein
MAKEKQSRINLEKYKDKVSEGIKKVDKPAELLNQSLDELVKVGGFDLLEANIDGVQNINPERKARRQIFLTESSKKAERESLRKTLEVWATVLSSSDDISEMIEACENNTEITKKTLNKNLLNAVEQCKDLERSYRSMAMFFKNAGSNKLKNVTFVNADLDQVKDLNDTRFIDAIQDELVQNYDRLDLRDNYSLLVIPGYLGSNKVVEKWAKIAHENKVMLVTDFEHLDTPDDVMEMFETSNLTGGDIYRSNVLMGCNWLVGRDKYEEAGEEDALYVPTAGALAGTIYQTLMSQVASGQQQVR